MWNEFLPISMPVTATAELSFWDMACSLSGRPLTSLSLVGQEHGRTIPKAAFGASLHDYAEVTKTGLDLGDAAHAARSGPSLVRRVEGSDRVLQFSQHAQCGVCACIRGVAEDIDAFVLQDRDGRQMEMCLVAVSWRTHFHNPRRVTCRVVFGHNSDELLAVHFYICHRALDFRLDVGHCG